MAQARLVCSVPKGLAGVCGPVWALAPQEYSKVPLTPAQRSLRAPSVSWASPRDHEPVGQLCCAPTPGILLSTMSYSGTVRSTQSES